MSVRHVERFQHRVARIAPNENIETAPIRLVWIGAGLPAAAWLSSAVRQFGINTGTTRLEVQEAGYIQSRIANDFAFQALPRIPPQQFILRIDPGGLRVEIGCLLISLRHYDQLLHPLHIPAAADKLVSQPIQQLGM